MNWTDDYLYFDYAIGIINDDDTFNKIQNIDFFSTDTYFKKNMFKGLT